jgi:hypothetical protein
MHVWRGVVYNGTTLETSGCGLAFCFPTVQRCIQRTILYNAHKKLVYNIQPLYTMLGRCKSDSLWALYNIVRCIAFEV